MVSIFQKIMPESAQDVQASGNHFARRSHAGGRPA